MDAHLGGATDRSDHGADVDTQPPVVLIVEDERGLANRYTAHLEGSYSVRTAHTGVQALDLLDDDVDVTLLDRRLSGWHGDELLAVIQDRGIDCQVAMMTAAAPDFDTVQLPIDEHLTKPVTREELRNAVEVLLLRSRVQPTEQKSSQLISRMSALERSKTDQELESHTEFATLERRTALAKEALGIRANDIGAIQAKYRPARRSACNRKRDVIAEWVTGYLQLESGICKPIECGEIEGGLDPNYRRFS